MGCVMFRPAPYFALVGLASSLLAGCSASSKTFYATPARVKDTQLCRTFFDAAEQGRLDFARDLAAEANRRGLTAEECKTKVETENGILIATAVIATAVGVGIACSRGCSGGRSVYSAPRFGSDDVDCYGGTGDGPRYIKGPVSVGWDDPYDLDRDGDGIGCEAIGDWGA